MAPPAVVLVGGEGTRLRPLTYATPKQLLPVAGLPLLRRVVEPLERAGVDRVVLSLGYRADAFEDLDLGSFDVSRVPEDSPLGSGGGIAHAVRTAGVDGTFIAMNGDVLGDVDIPGILEHHRKTGARATILVKEVDDPSEFGVVVTDAGGSVTGFVEKPRPPAPSNLINAGVWVLESSILDGIAVGGAASIEREVFPGLAERGEMQAFVHQGWWHDVGRLDRYLAANAELLRRGDAPEGWSRSGDSLIGPGARVDPTAELIESVVGAGCRVADGATVSGSVLLDGAEVGSGATVEASVLGFGWQVAAGEKVAGSILAATPEKGAQS
jgi:mannose-1-phosphate guanylyltransferase